MKATISEDEFQRQVIQYAQLMGWMVAHFRPSMNARGKWQTAVQGDGAGFPDLVLVRGETLLFVELKVGKNTPSPQQHAWLEAINKTQCGALVWYPQDWPEIERILSHQER